MRIQQIKASDAQRPLVTPADLHDMKRFERKSFGGRQMFVPRMANPMIGGVDNAIDSYLYDTVTVAANTAFPKTTMFSVPIGGSKTLAQTNMVGQSRLPGATRFLVATLQVHVFGNCVVNDLVALYTNTSVQLVFNNKPFVQGPPQLFPAGCGLIQASLAQIGVGAAGDVTAFSTSNGVPDPRSVFAFVPPLDVGPDETFNVILTPETAWSTQNAGRPIGTGITIQVIMAGKYFLIVN